MNGLSLKPMRAADITTSGTIEPWLAENNMGLAVTTGISMRLLTFGTENDGRIAVCESVFDGPRALWSDGKTMFVSSRSRIHRLTYGAAPGRLPDHEERFFCPRSTHTTGELDIGDMARNAEGRPVFVNTQFNCLSTLDDKHSFSPVWRPPFISKLSPENRCHLSGLAMRNGAPAYVTAYAATDTPNGYLAKRRDGGCIVDVAAKKIVAEGLCLPRSPRWYQEKLWLHQAGTGYFGFWDFDRRVFEPIAFCPGLLDGLVFFGPYAVMGYSLPRTSEQIAGLPLEKNLREKGATARCGVHVVDTRSGEVVHWIRLEGELREVCGVALLEGVKKPLVLTVG